jgi:hypothetical protein
MHYTHSSKNEENDLESRPSWDMVAWPGVSLSAAAGAVCVCVREREREKRESE